MDPISVAASITTLIGVTTKVVGYVNSVTNAPKEREFLLQEATDLLPMLSRLKNQVSEPKPWSEGTRYLLNENGAFDQLQQALEKLAKKLQPEKGIRKVARNFIWTLDKDDCDDTLKKIERVKSRISVALQGDILKNTQAIKADTVNIDAIHEGVSELRIKERAKGRPDILEWFSPLNFYKTQQDVFGRREEGTGRWFIHSDEFQKWTAGSERTLCCYGIPGAGKSVLASVVVDYLRNEFTSGHSFGVAAAYCNFKEVDMQDSVNILSGLCMQLIDNSEPFPEILVDLYKSHNERKTRLGLKDVMNVFDDVLKSFKTAYLIVDALDECSSTVRDILVQELKALQSTTSLIVTTRPIDSIIREFSEDVSIEIRASYGDLDKYITSTIASSSKLSSLLRGQAMLANEISSKVIAKANGMFLAARLHMESLSTKMTVTRLKKAIDSLPISLDQLYDDAFHRINVSNEDSRVFAHKALRWVAYTYRPLTVHELKEALAIEPGDEDFDSDAQPEVDDVLESCVGLLVVNNESEVRLVHYTAQVYLEGLLATRYRDALASIAGDCITYLSYDVFQLPMQSDERSISGDLDISDYPFQESLPESDERSISGDSDISDYVFRGLSFNSNSKQSKHHLLDYTSKFWAQHVTAGHASTLDAQVIRFLASNPRISLYPDRTSPREMKKTTGIGIAAYYGLNNALKHLLQYSVGIDEQSFPGFSALHLAAINDRVAATAILLEHGADIECKSHRGGTPLTIAISNRSSETARLLVESGASVTVTDIDGYGIFASVGFDSPIPFLQLLLDHGADINSVAGWPGTQLMNSAYKGDLETVRWLLTEGAEINLQGSHGDTALHVAIVKNEVEIVALLLENGADPRINDARLENALDDACKGGKVTIAKLIIDSGMDIDAPSWYNYNERSALHRVARFGPIESVEVLVANNANIDKQDGDGVTPLMTAINVGSTSAIRVLIDAGADLDLQDEGGCSALHWAAARGDASTIKELLRRRATVDERSSLTLTHGTPRSLFSHRGAESLHLARDNGIEVLALSSQLLLSFVYHEPFNILYMLGRHTMEEFREWDDGMTALDIALVRNDEECINLLEPGTGFRTGFTALSIGEYLCDVFGYSSVMELEDMMKRKCAEQGFSSAKEIEEEMKRQELWETSSDGNSSGAED
ncbi:MAG: hypothetical protein Q9171_003737 [Xanthocarpia ochracea]